MVRELEEQLEISFSGKLWDIEHLLGCCDACRPCPNYSDILDTTVAVLHTQRCTKHWLQLLHSERGLLDVAECSVSPLEPPLDVMWKMWRKLSFGMDRTKGCSVPQPYKWCSFAIG